MYHEMFPPEVLALQEEITRHPALIAQLATCNSTAIEDRLAEVAAFCGVILDGTYDDADLVKLCGTLTNKLKEANEELIRDIAKPIVLQ